MNQPSKFWDRIAERYSKKPVSDEDSYQKKLQITHEYLRSDMEVLEFGCGTGSTAITHGPACQNDLAERANRYQPTAVAKPPPKSLIASLRDGTRVLIRPVIPEDKAGLQEGLSRLSFRSRYQRFLAPMTAFSEKQLGYLTEIDYDDHMAWAAVELGRSPPRGLGVARYIRLKGEPKVAELAVAVVDSHQGRGLGSLLLAMLSRSAAQNGIETFLGHVLAENTQVMRIARRWGARVDRDRQGVLKVTAPVPGKVPLPTAY